MSSIQKRELPLRAQDKKPRIVWRARYRDEAGREHARHFKRQIDALQWLKEVEATQVTGTYVDPAKAKMTVGEWCDAWLVGYGTRRPSTVRQAKVHVRVIVAHFGGRRLSTIKPSDVKAWTVKLQETYAPSTTYAIYRRFVQVMADAVDDGLIAKSPCSRKTSPGPAAQRPYVASTEQVWALHDAMPDHLRPAVLLGAFAGLRVAEAAALRVEDVDFIRGVITPAIQYPGEPLKSETSRTPIPIPNELALALSANVAKWRSVTVVTNDIGRPATPWAIERAMREARVKVEGLPDGFRYHDLRHYLASLLISHGLDIKVVQTRLRHATATTTLNVYAHLMPDKDESAQAAIAGVLAARADSVRTGTL